MKKILILLVTIFCMNMAYAQIPSDTIYLIGTTIGPEGDNGILRDDSEEYHNDPLYKIPPIHIELRVKSKNINVSFGHYNYNPAELAKTRPVRPIDEMVILIKPIEFLQTIKLQDLDLMFSTITSNRETTLGFMKTMWDKTIFFIDRNEITPTTVRLIQVKDDTPDSY